MKKPQASFALRQRPGFLIRRLHQIHVAIFLEECAEFDITPVQYSLMSALAEHAPVDQASLAAEIGIDRTTVAGVLRRLEGRGLAARSGSELDRRLKMCKLTAKGLQLLKRMEPAARRAHDRTIAALDPQTRRVFAAALEQLVDANNALGRAFLRLG
jgi:MarR family transcriptional regulator, lower aerobic nicotinate degradation pathway regulator